MFIFSLFKKNSKRRISNNNRIQVCYHPYNYLVGSISYHYNIKLNNLFRFLIHSYCISWHPNEEYVYLIFGRRVHQDNGLIVYIYCIAQLNINTNCHLMEILCCQYSQIYHIYLFNFISFLFCNQFSWQWEIITVKCYFIRIMFLCCFQYIELQTRSFNIFSNFGRDSCQNGWFYITVTKKNITTKYIWHSMLDPMFLFQVIAEIKY